MNKLTSEQIEAVTKSLEKYKALRHSYFITDDELRHALEQVGEGEDAINRSHHYSPDATTAMNCLICGKSKWMHTI